MVVQATKTLKLRLAATSGIATLPLRQPLETTPESAGAG
jgi:hypothetical protein